MRTHSSHRQRSWRFWMVLLVLVLLLGGIGISALRILPFGHAISVLPIRRFPVGQQPTVTVSIAGSNGNIEVQGGAGQMVTVTAIIERNFLGSDPAITSTQADPDHLLLTGNASPLAVLGANSITFALTVPAATNLDLRTGVGDITVRGIQGQLRAQNTAGSISATQMTLTGTGKMQTTAGSLTFNGTFAPATHDQFSSTTGSIALALPATSSFHVDASTDAGSITSDFAGVHIVNKHPAGVGSEAHGAVGRNGQGMPTAWLTLHTSTGSISLTQAASQEASLW